MMKNTIVESKMKTKDGNANIAMSNVKSTNKETVFFKLKQLHGDQGIYLGQSILALIGLNESPAYTEKINHSFKVELFASLIEELNITPEELRKELDGRLQLDED